MKVSSFFEKPRKAWEYFRSKGLKPTFSYADMEKYEHDVSFVVAKMLDIDLLQSMQDAVESAIELGLTFKEFQDMIIPTLQDKGWWGEREVIDPKTGKKVLSKLGSVYRLEVIFDTNLKTSYAKGQAEEILSYAKSAPYLMYDAVLDSKTRPFHRKWNNTLLPINDKWWDDHYPPCGYRCRCGVIQLSKQEIDEMGLTVSKNAPDDGFYVWTNPRTGKKLNVANGTDPLFYGLFDKNKKTIENDILIEKINNLIGPMKVKALEWMKKYEKNTNI